MTRTKKTTVFALLISLSTLLSVFCTLKKETPAVQVKAVFDTELAKLQEIVDQELITAVQKEDTAQTRQSFLKARSQYKNIEYYIEYFFPTTSVLLNGAPIDEIELGENLIKQPSGFQVMEELIYDAPSKENSKALLNEVQKMQLNLKRAARYNAQYELTDAQLFDAMRLEIFRITSLGITGFDTPASLQALPETVSALKGIKAVLQHYDSPNQLEKLLDDAINYIKRKGDYNSFDRLAFTTQYLQPIGKSLNQLRIKNRIER